MVIIMRNTWADIDRLVGFYFLQRYKLACRTSAAGFHIVTKIFKSHVYLLLVDREIMCHKGIGLKAFLHSNIFINKLNYFFQEKLVKIPVDGNEQFVLHMLLSLRKEKSDEGTGREDR